MKIKNLLIIFISVLAILITLSVKANSGISIEIKVKPSFNVGEQLSFTYILISDENQRVVYLPYIDCPQAPVAFIETRSADLKKEVPFKEVYYGAEINESIEPQNCTAYLEIISPVQKREEKEFKITTKPSFDFHILACKDVRCQERTKIYQVGKSFYLSYIAGVEKPQISAKLIKPNKKEVKVALDTPVILDKEGRYILEATATKQGYKIMKDAVEIGVVKEFTAPVDLRVCNTDGICEANKGENYHNCPEDCAAPKAARKLIYYILIGLGILIAIGAGIYFFYRLISCFGWVK